MQFLALSVLALAQSILACPETQLEARADAAIPWNYNKAGDDWVRIGYPTCSGNQQSPISIKSSDGPSKLHTPSLQGFNKAIPGKFGNWGYGPNFTAADLPPSANLPKVTFDGETTYFAQWHTHTPAEHPIDGRRAAAEIHLVQTTSDGTARAVFAITIDEGDDSSCSSFFSQFPSPLPSPSRNTPVNTRIDMGPLLAAVGNFKSYYTYSGSLTTPPCTQGKRFFLATQTLRICRSQLQQLQSVSKFSARTPQPIIDQGLNK